MKLKLLPVFFLVLLTVAAFAQEKGNLNPCGTKDGIVPWLQAYQQNEIAYPKSDDLLLLPVTVHLVGNSAGGGYFSVKNLLAAFCTLNKDFLPVDIQFFIEGEINYIPNSLYYDHDWDAGYQMMEENNVPNTINCYIVDSPAGNCGYSGWGLGVALAKSCTGPFDHTWAHEVGHFLSLPHPFVGWEGYEHNYSQPAPFEIDGHPVELADSTNCTFAGDGFCDTPPDYLNYRWSCNDLSQSGVVEHDPNGVPFTSDGTLFMSYSNDACMYRFSDEQIAAMRANVMTEKESYLYDQQVMEPVEVTDLIPISPAEGETVPYFQNVTFEWEPMPNATSYLLEITRLEHFPFVLFRYVVNGTNFTCTDLFKNKTYYWRVLPFNRQHTCTDQYSTVASFITGELSAVETIGFVTGFDLQPNPVAAGQKLQVVLGVSEFQQLDVSLLNTAGQVVKSLQWEVVPGQNRKPLATEDLQPGIYLLQLRSGDGVMTRKVMIGK